MWTAMRTGLRQQSQLLSAVTHAPVSPAETARAFLAQAAAYSGAAHKLESENAKKLFAKATMTGGQPLDPADLESAAQAAGRGVPESTLDKVFKAISGVMFWGGAAVAAYAGYLTYFYTVEEVEAQIKETDRSDWAGNAWAEAATYYVENRKWAVERYHEYADPPTDQLLPPLPAHLQDGQIRTLVLDLEDVLIHSDWNRQRGWVTYKRPGVDDFLKKMVESGYELVLYTDTLNTYSDPIMDRLDPGRQLVPWRLTRNCTQWHDGVHVRDLGKLGRKLEHVMFLTTEKKAACFHGDNTVVISKFEPEKTAEDTVLVDLIPFFEMVSKTKVKDVREVVRSYDGEDVPAAFKKRMRELAEQQKSAPPQRRGFFSKLSGSG